MTADLVAFLNARLDEREKVAKAAAARVRRWDKTTRPPWVRAREFAQEERYAALEAFEGRETPEQVLADVQAKRAILKQYEADTAAQTGMNPLVVAVRQDRMHFTVCALASVFADHPDFNPAWRVSTAVVGGHQT